MRHEYPTPAELRARLEAATKRFAETPPPEPALQGFSPASLRRAIKRARAGQAPVDVPGLSAEEAVEAMERTLQWEEMCIWLRSELRDIQLTVVVAHDLIADKLLNDCLAVFHVARRLAKEQGPDSAIAKAALDMERAWRESHPRAKKADSRRRRVPARR